MGVCEHGSMGVPPGDVAAKLPPIGTPILPHAHTPTRFPRLLLLLALLLTAALAFATPITDPDVLDILRQAPTVKDYPHDDAVWLLRDMEITVDVAGGVTVREHKLIKLLTPAALSLANWEIPYDKENETLEVRTARTLLNGQEFAVEPQQIRESAAYPGIAWYDALVMRRFPMPAAMVGAVLEVETIFRRALPRMPGDFSTRLTMRQPYPIRRAQYTMHTPAALPLTIRFTGANPPALEETAEHGGHRYHWAVQNVEALRMDEPQMPASAELLPSARITALTGWEPVVVWYNLIAAGKDALTADLRRVATERTAGCATAPEKIAALHKAVREMPYIAVEMGNLGDAPHPADDTLRHNYGDCKEKATLLKALLKAVGIESDYVLVRTTDVGPLDPQLYGPAEFNHVILTARLPDGDHFLDPTLAEVPATRLPFGVEGGQALILRGAGELVTLPLSTAVDNRTEIKVTATVNADGSAAGHARLTFYGLVAALQRGMLSGVPNQQFREALEGTLAPRLGTDIAVTAVQVDHLREADRPLAIAVDFSSRAYLQPAGQQWSGSLPQFTYQSNNYRATRKRTWPFLVRMESSVHLDVTIKLPAGVQVTALPSSVEEDSPFGHYQDSISIDGLTIQYTSDLATKHGLFPPSALDAMQHWASALALEGRNSLQFFVKRP